MDVLRLALLYVFRYNEDFGNRDSSRLESSARIVLGGRGTDCPSRRGELGVGADLSPMLALYAGHGKEYRPYLLHDLGDPGQCNDAVASVLFGFGDYGILETTGFPLDVWSASTLYRSSARFTSSSSGSVMPQWSLKFSTVRTPCEAGTEHIGLQFQQYVIGRL